MLRREILLSFPALATSLFLKPKLKAEETCIQHGDVTFFCVDSKIVRAEYANGDKYWYLNGQLNREDGSAIECANGDKHWYLNGKRHREDGPAIECINGDKHWYKNGERHREDGPAVESAGGYKSWWLNGCHQRSSLLG